MYIIFIATTLQWLQNKMTILSISFSLHLSCSPSTVSCFASFLKVCNCAFFVWTEYIVHCDNQTSLLVTSIMCWGPEPSWTITRLVWPEKTVDLTFCDTTTPPLLSQQNNIRQRTAEIPYADDASLLGSTSAWLKQIFLAPQQITHTSQIWVVKCSPSQTSFHGKTSGENVGCFLSLKSTATTWTTTLKRPCFLEARQDRNLNKQ